MESIPRELVFYSVASLVALTALGGCSRLTTPKETTPISAPAPPPPPSPSQAEASTTDASEGKKVEQTGTASFYGPQFHGQETASGETFDQNDLTAAHKTLPLGTKTKVTNLETGKSVEVTINDRGPYVKGRKIDLSTAAAQKIGLTKKKGVAKVKITTIPKKKVRSKNLKQTPRKKSAKSAAQKPLTQN